jgi:hypothetical protein
VPRATITPTIIAVAGCLGFAALALTTYTFPIEGASSDPALYALLSSALHDPQPVAHPRLGSSPLQLTSNASADTALASPPPDPEHQPTAGRDDAGAWAKAAAAVDSGALRDWLGRWVVATTTTSHDTVRLTLHRWSRRPGCPWLSTLVATTTGAAQGDSRLVRITATCPRVSGASPAVQP